MTRDEIQNIVNTSRASQNKIELAKVIEYVGEIQPKVILEIGAWRGYSMEVWAKAFNPSVMLGVENDATVIDPALNQQLDIIVGDSHDEKTLRIVKDELAGRAVDFLFIDGDHTYEGVKRDYEFYAPLVRSGGIVGFHDTALSSNEWRMAGVDVQRFYNELIGPSGSKYLTFWDEVGKGTGTGLYYVNR